MYSVIKQKRKTIGIVVDDNLEVIIKVPYGVPKRQIEELVAKYSNWIEDTIAIKKQRLQKNDWLSTGTIGYLGNKVNIEIKHNPIKNNVKCIEGVFVVETLDIHNEAHIKTQMDDYLRKQAKILFTTLTNKYCQQLHLTYNKISIRKQKTRWGSCSRNGNLSYNVRLLGAPIEVVEYVILHEVMHLKYFDHSKAFWNHIGEVMPNYKNHQRYLKEKGIYLDY